MTDALAVVAAHPDDEVLGCGGTIAKFASSGRAVHVLLLADGENARAAPGAATVSPTLTGARADAAQAAGRILGCASVTLLDLPDNRLDTMALLDVTKQVEEFLRRHRPSTVFTHHSGDVNIDHRVAHDAVVVACRSQPDFPVREMLFFEVPSSTEWRPPSSAEMFCPNWFVDISATLAIKQAALQAYAEELRPFPHPRSVAAVEALARWRGSTVGVNAAEAFVLGRKVIR
jgi:N-acetylglucosamine malate deacetylase 1